MRSPDHVEGVARPRVLLILLDNWHGVARLPAALHEAGFEVGLVSEPHYIAARSRFVDRHFAISMHDVRRGRLQPVWQAIESFAPGFLIPADEYAVRFVQFVLSHPRLAGVSSKARELLEHSTGGQHTVPNPIGRRGRMLDLAASLGLDCPAHQVVQSLAEAAAFADRHGWPVYLKRDHSSGGYWVRQCANEAALEAAYRYLTGADTSAWSLGRLHRLPKHLARSLVFRANPTALPPREIAISVEASITGEPAYHTAVALEGRWLAGISAEVEDYYPRPTGPSTRVRLHADAAMDKAAGKLISALAYSGICGLDFIRRPDGGLTFIEFNARPTPVAHLGSLIGADLGSALYSALRGGPASKPPTGAGVRVALFPQDWRREPASDHRKHLHLDIPRDDPALIDAFRHLLPTDWDRCSNSPGR